MKRDDDLQPGKLEQTVKSKTKVFFADHFFQKRLDSPVSWLALTALSLAIAVGVVQYGPVFGILIILATVGAPVLFSTMFSIRLGVYLAITISCTLGLILMLLPNVKIGLLQDSLILFMMIGYLYRSYMNHQWDGFKTPLNIPILIWIGYNILQIANPIAASRVAWFFVMRPAVGYILLFYLCYNMMETKRDIKNLINLLIILCSFSSIWGLIQFFNGYFPFEMEYVIANDAVHLVFINGRWRSFGTMASPAQYGVVMAAMLILIPLLNRGKHKWYRKWLYRIAAILALLAMIYSGTRSAIAILPVAILALIVFAKNWRFYLAGGLVGVIFIGIINMPTRNYHIQRLQSTFSGKKDESYMVRQRNREMIYPWILAHPMGGGLGSTGVWGQKFSPGTFLANFPPDSGFVRVAVELGWIGFIFYIFLWGNILLKGALNYWKMHDEELKTIVLALLCMLSGVFVVEYAQDIVGKTPFNLLFWVFCAILFKSIKMDQNLWEESEKKKDAEEPEFKNQPNTGVAV